MDRSGVPPSSSPPAPAAASWGKTPHTLKATLPTGRDSGRLEPNSGPERHPQGHCLATVTAWGGFRIYRGTRHAHILQWAEVT